MVRGAEKLIQIIDKIWVDGYPKDMNLDQWPEGDARFRPFFAGRKLVDPYHTNPVLARVIDYVAARQREPRKGETKAHTLQTELGLTLEESLSVLRELEAAECGQVYNGKPKKNTRLVWEVKALKMAQFVREQARKPPDDRPRDDDSSEQDPYETQKFSIRPGLAVTLLLPRDSTADELNNLAEYIKVLARTRRSA